MRFKVEIIGTDKEIGQFYKLKKGWQKDVKYLQKKICMRVGYHLVITDWHQIISSKKTVEIVNKITAELIF